MQILHDWRLQCLPTPCSLILLAPEPQSRKKGIVTGQGNIRERLLAILKNLCSFQLL
jgi:hypothetical protein